MFSGLPEHLNIAERFLDARVAEGRGDKVALLAGDRRISYAEVQAQANRFANLLGELGVEVEQRVIVGLPDIPEYVAALFGTLKTGAAAVMVNCNLKPDEIAYFYEYTRAKVAIVHVEQLAAFAEAASGARHLRTVVVVGDASWDERVARASDRYDNYPTHRDDGAVWLFSGGTTGRPKAVVQTHGSYANTTELYGKRTLAYSESDVTLSVPKLYFGYATGANLFFPFSVGATSILFPERCTADALFALIAKHRPTILINVPTMVNNMLSHPAAAEQDLSCLRLATSAGEALPVELYKRWKDAFGVELLDGLGTAEMWHVFLTNKPDDVRPGTLGKAVDGFDVKVADDDGRECAPGEIGRLWVRGASRAVGYWHDLPKSMRAFRGEWYVSEDMLVRDADGYFTYCGRGDDMLKVGGKWLAPGEVENCLMQHPAVKECAVVGVTDASGLVKPHTFVIASGPHTGLEEELKAWVRDKLEPYKAPRHVEVRSDLPRTHLGKIDRGKLRRG